MSEFPLAPARGCAQNASETPLPIHERSKRDASISATLRVNRVVFSLSYAAHVALDRPPVCTVRRPAFRDQSIRATSASARAGSGAATSAPQRFGRSNGRTCGNHPVGSARQNRRTGHQWTAYRASHDAIWQRVLPHRRSGRRLAPRGTSAFRHARSALDNSRILISAAAYNLAASPCPYSRALLPTKFPLG